MKGLIIAFSSLWLIFPTVLATDSNATNDIPISFSDLFRGTNQSITNNLNTLQIIKSQGYPAEAHAVTTEDGYILTMHRIPGKPGSPAVFLQHPFLGSSTDWFYVNKTESLAFLLADNGYDVWFGNLRGNTYSRAHVNLPIDDNRFWDFSWHESGVYDLPAMLTYIAEMKGNPLSAYIGYSMGTTTFCVLATERPDVASLLQSAYLLAPIVYVDHVQTPLVEFLAQIDGPLKALFDFLTHGEFLPNSVFVNILFKYLCYANLFEQKVCIKLLGYDDTNIDYRFMSTFTNHFPAGASIKQWIHYSQVYKSKRFRQYDYGKDKNLKIYNSTEPPDYNISRITTPLALFWSEGDAISTRQDVARFVSELPRKPIFYTVPNKKFSHLDFGVAKDARELVYNELIDILTKNKLNVQKET